MIVTCTQMKNSFGRYLKEALKQGEILIEKHGKVVAKLVSSEKSLTFLADDLKGIANAQEDEDTVLR